MVKVRTPDAPRKYNQQTISDINRAIRELSLKVTDNIAATGTTVGRTLADRFAEVINVKDYEAIGDGVTDDTTAIQAAIDAANTTDAMVFIPPGTYIISSPLVFKAPMMGSSINSDITEGTVIKAISSFSGGQMLDFNDAAEGKFMKNIQWNANGVASLKIFGSSSSGSAGGSPNTLFENCFFTGTDNATYATGAFSTLSENGMFTGSVWINCRWINVSQAILVGDNQDDVTFIGSRIHMHSSDSRIRVIKGGGINCKFISTFVAS